MVAAELEALTFTYGEAIKITTDPGAQFPTVSVLLAPRNASETTNQFIKAEMTLEITDGYPIQACDLAIIGAAGLPDAVSEHARLHAIPHQPHCSTFLDNPQPWCPCHEN